MNRRIARPLRPSAGAESICAGRMLATAMAWLARAAGTGRAAVVGASEEAERVASPGSRTLGYWKREGREVSGCLLGADRERHQGRSGAARSVGRGAGGGSLRSALWKGVRRLSLACAGAIGLLLGTAGLVPETAGARTLIGNLDGSNSRFRMTLNCGQRYATQFTNGSDTDFNLSGIILEFESVTGNSRLNNAVQVQIRQYISGSNIPGDVITNGTLSNPASIQAGENLFTASNTITIAADSSYYLYVTSTRHLGSGNPADNADSGPKAFRTTTEADSGSATDWSLGDGRLATHTSISNCPSGQFWRTTTSRIKFRLYGGTDGVNDDPDGQPRITGEARVGETLTADISGIIDPDGTPAEDGFDYQWFREASGGAPTEIFGATESQYVVTSADAGHKILVRVTFTDDGNSEEVVTSSATDAVESSNTDPTGMPAIQLDGSDISRAPKVGETLTATPGDIADVDGLVGTTYTYQWQRENQLRTGWDDISADNPYTLVRADRNRRIRVIATFTDQGNTEEMLTSDPTDAVANRDDADPEGDLSITVDGDEAVQVDAVLRADTSGITDPVNGLDMVTYNYNWERSDDGVGDGLNRVPITGQTMETYTLTRADDLGKYLRVVVSFMDDDGYPFVMRSDWVGPVTVLGGTPSTGDLEISVDDDGAVRVGAQLEADTANIGDPADGLTSPTYTYQWERADGITDPANPTGLTSVGTDSVNYTPVKADQDKYLRVTVTFNDDDGNEETKTSDWTSAVARRDNSPATGEPTISGTVAEGQELTAAPGTIADANGTTGVTYTYQWQWRNSSNVWVDRGSPSVLATYTPVAADVGGPLRVEAMFTDEDGYPEVRTSLPTVNVAPGPPSVSIEGPASAVMEGGDLVYTVRLNRPDHTQPITVTYSVAGGGSNAASLTDYSDTATNVGTITIGTGANSGTITISSVQDSVYEADEGVSVTLTGATNAALPSNTADRTVTGTIENDDAAPIVSIAVKTSPATEGANLEFTVTAVGDSEVPATVPYEVTPGTTNPANLDIDIDSSATGTVTIASGTGSRTEDILIATATDDIDEYDETVTVTLVAMDLLHATRTTTEADRSAIGTITDDNGPPMASMSRETATEGVAESGGIHTFRISLNVASGKTIAVQYGLGGTASLSRDGTTGDYTVSPRSPLTFAPGTMFRDVTVTILDDTTDEENETIEIALQPPLVPADLALTGTVANRSATGTITDNDNSPTVEISRTTGASLPEGTDHTFTVSLSAASGRTVTVPYALAGTATASAPGAPGDYEAVPPSPLVFVPNAPLSQTITIDTVDDEIDEDGETVSATLQSPTNARLITNTSVTSTIADNDVPLITIADASANEGDDITFTVTKSILGGFDPDFNFTVNWAVTSGGGAGTAVAGTDYPTTKADSSSNTSGTLTFSANNDAAQTFTVSTTNVAGSDGDKDFTVTLSSISGGSAMFEGNAATVTARGTIIDDELPQITVAAGASPAEGNAATFTLTRLGGTASALTVGYEITQPTGNMLLPGVALPISGTATFAAGSATATVEVDTWDDNLDEIDSTLTLTLSIPQSGAGYELGTATTANVTVADDDDEPVVGISSDQNGETITEGAAILAQLSLSAISGKDVMVDFTIGGDVETHDYPVSTVRTLTIPAGVRFLPFTVETTDDDRDEPDEAITVTLGTIVNAGLASTQSDRRVAFTLTDNDGLPELSIEGPAAGVVEGGDLVYTVHVTPVSGKQITVPYVVDGVQTETGRSASADDYSGENSRVLTIPANAATATITISTVDDTSYEPLGEGLRVKLEDQWFISPGTVFVANAVRPNDSNEKYRAVATILDNDGLPQISIDEPSSAVTEGEQTQLTVRTSSPASELIDVHFSFSGTAIDGVDYFPSRNATIQRGESDARISVSIPTDMRAEGDETLVVTLLSASENAVLTSTLEDRSATLTIIDANLPEITVVPVNSTVTEGENAVFELTREYSGSILDVNFAITDAGSVVTGSFPTTAQFGAESTTVRVVLPTSNDNTAGGDATVTLTLAASDADGNSDNDNYSIGDPPRHASLIVRDDEGAPRVSVADPAPVVESNDLTFVVSLLPASSAEVTVNYSIADGTATVTNDYTLPYIGATGSITIPAGQTTENIIVPTVGDSLNEPTSETFTLTLASVSSTDSQVQLVTGGSAATGTVTDDDTVVVSIEQANSSRNEGARNLSFQIRANPAPFAPIGVGWNTEDITARGSQIFNRGDFRHAMLSTDVGTSGTLMWNLDTFNDDFDEDDETLRVQLIGILSNPSNVAAELSSDPSAISAILTVVDTDIPSFSVSDALAEEGDSVEFTVTKNILSYRTEDILVDWAVTSSGSTPATAGTDYNAMDGSGTLTFDSDLVTGGELEKTITVRTIDTSADDGDRTFTVTLSNIRTSSETSGVGTFPSGGDTATGTIRGNELPTVSVTSGNTPTEGSSAIFTLTRENATGTLTVPITVEQRSGDMLPGTPNLPTMAVFTDGNATTTVTVMTQGDNLDEDNAVLRLTLDEPVDGAAYSLGSPSHRDLIISDDEMRPHVSIAEPGSAGRVSEGSTITFRVGLDEASGRDVSVGYTIGGDVASNDYTLLSLNPLTIAAGDTTGTIRIATTDDTRDESNENLVVSLGTLTNVDPATVMASRSATGAIEDNDGIPTLRIVGPSSPVPEGEDMTFSVIVNPESGKDITVRYDVEGGAGVSSGSAFIADDYTDSGSGTLTIPANTPAGTISIAANDDHVDEYDETLTVTLQATGHVNATRSTVPSEQFATGIISDTDAPPTISVTTDTAPVREGSSVFFRFSITPAESGGEKEAYKNYHIPYAIVTSGSNSATLGDDYTVTDFSTSPLLLCCSDGSVTLRINTVDDAIAEPNEDITVVIGDLIDSIPHPTENSATATIADNDTPEFSIANSSATEGSPVIFTVTKSIESYQPISVNWAVTPVTDGAAAGTDYVNVAENIGGTLRFAAAETMKSFQVRTINTTTTDGNRDFLVTLSNVAPAGSATLSEAPDPTTARGTVIDDEQATVSVSGNAPTEGEAAVFTLTRTGATDGLLMVPFTVTQTAGNMLTTAALPASATFAANSTTTEVSVPTQQDSVYETDAILRLVLSTPTADYGLGSPSSYDITVSDNDSPPEVSIAAPSASVSEGGALVFTVTAVGASDLPATVPYTLSGGATNPADIDADTDRTSTTGTVTVPSGAANRTATITVNTVNDTRNEHDETLTITLGTPTDATLTSVTANRSATGTITDNDNTLPVLTITGPAAAAAEGGSLEFTVTVTPESGKEITVPYSVTGSGTYPAAAADFSGGGSGTLTIPADSATGTITIGLVDDALDEHDEGLSVELLSVPTPPLSPPTNATVSTTLSERTASGTITDGDSPPAASVAITQSTDAAVDEGDPLSFTVSLASVSGKMVTVPYTLGGTATSAAGATNDYTAPDPLQVTIAAGDDEATITIATTDDIRDEANETVIVTLDAPADASATVASAPGNSATGTINDDDVPAFTIADASASEGDAVEFTVTKSIESYQEIRVNWAVTVETGDTATAGTSYPNTVPGTSTSNIGGTLAFAANSTEETISVATTENTMANGNRTFTVTLSNVSPSGAATLPSDPTATGRIIDDEKPTVSVSGPSTNPTEGSDAIFTLTREGPTTAELMVRYTVEQTAGNMLPSTFDEAMVRTATIAAGASTATVTVPTEGDSLDEIDANLRLTLSAVAGSAAYALGAAAVANITVEDNDSPPTVTLDALTGQAASASETGARTTLAFTIRLSAASGKDVIVPYTLGGTATAASGATNDYTAAPASPVTITAGNTTATVTITARDDTRDEPDETVIVTLGTPTGTPPTGTLGSSTQATGTIEDTDSEPVVSIAATTSSADEGQNLVFTVTVTPESGKEITVPYTVQGGTSNPAAAADFTGGAARTLTIPANSSTGTITIVTATDALDENDETLDVEIQETGLQNATRHATSYSATGTITDLNPLPKVSVEGPGASVTEGGSLVFTFTLAPVSGRQVAVPYTIAGSGADAAESTDYTDVTTPTPGTLTFDPGDTEATVTIRAEDDDVDDDVESLTVTVGSGTTFAPADAMADRSATGSIDDNDTPMFSIADASASEGDAITFAVTRDIASYRDIMVDWAVSVESGDTATAGTDYPSTASNIGGTLTFAPASTEETFTVATTENSIIDRNRTFTVTLSNIDPSGAATFADATATGTIVDDERPSISVSGNAPAEGEDAVFTLTREGPSTTALTVAFTVEQTSGDMLTGVPLPTEVSIGTGVASATVAVPTQDDSMYEEDATVRLTLTPTDDTAPYGLGGTSSYDITVSDDDDPPTLSIAGPSSPVAEGGGLAFTITAVGDSSLPATVTYAVAGGATNPADIDADLSGAMATGSFDIAAGTGSRTGFITLATVDDAFNEEDETVIVTLTNPLQGASGNTTNAILTSVAAGQSATATIADNDGLPSVSIAGPSAAVAEGSDLVFTVTLAPASGREVTVPYTVAGSGTNAAAAGDFTDTTTPTAGTLTIAPGATEATITITAVDDTLDEEDEETFTVTLNNPATAVGNATNAILTATPSGQSATGAIADNDAPPAASIAIAGAASVDEAGGASLVYRVTLSAASGRQVTVPYTLGGTADAQDYTVVPASPLSIVAGDTTADITVNPIDDSVDEPDETVEIALGTPVGATLAAGSSATGAIADNDLPLVTAAPASALVDEGDPAVFTLTREGILTGTLDVQFTVAQSADSDILSDPPPMLPATAQFAAGSATVTVSVPTHDDDVDEPNGSLTLTLARSAGYRIGGGAATVAVRDDEGPPEVRVAATPPSVPEGQDLVFTVSLTRRTTQAVTVPFTLDGTAEAGAEEEGADYAPPQSMQVVIPAGSASAAVTLQTYGNDLDEQDRTVTIDLGSPTPTSVLLASDPADRTATGTIADDDLELAVSIVESGTLRVQEGMSVAFAVSLSRPSVHQVAVPYSVTGGAGSPATPSDYSLSWNCPDPFPEGFEDLECSSHLLFAPGVTSLPITVTAANDHIADSGEEAVFALGDPEGGGAVSSANTSLSIVITSYDPVAPPSAPPAIISVSVEAPPPPGEGEEEQEIVYEFVVSLSQPLSYSVVVPYVITLDETGTASGALARSSASSARPLVDLRSGEALFLPGQTSQTVEVAIPENDQPGQVRELAMRLGEPELAPTESPAPSKVLPEIEPASDTAEIETIGGMEVVAAESISIVDSKAAGKRRAAGLTQVLAGIGRSHATGIVEVLWSRIGALESAADGSVAVVGGRSIDTAAFQSGETAGRAATEVARLFGVEFAAPDDSPQWDTGRSHSGDGLSSYRDWANIPDQLALAKRTSFAFPLQGDGGGQGYFTLWGEGVYKGFKSRTMNDDYAGIATDGTALSGHFGIDYRFLNSAAFGIALNSTSSDVEYAFDSDRVGAAADARITSAAPYFHWGVSDSMGFWATAGVGTGTATLEEEGSSKVETDITATLAAVGIRSRPATAGTIDFAVKADAFATALDTDEEGRGILLAEASAEASRVRVAVEGSVNSTFDGGSSFARRMELGARQDSGDDVSGVGADFLAEFQYANPQGSTRLNGRAGAVLFHGESGFREWGVGFGVVYEPGVGGRGLSLSLEPGWNASVADSESGMWDAQSALHVDEDAGDGAVMKARLGHGLGVLSGMALMTSYSEMELAEESRRLRFGAEFSPGPADGRFLIDLYGERTDGGDGADNAVMLRATAGY